MMNLLQKTLLFVLILGLQLEVKAFPRISRPEFFWVLAHPFVAKKALKTSREVLIITIKQKKLNYPDTLISGGNLDAFKHAFWMACLSSKIGKKKAIKLGKAHEKGNFIEYKKNKKEDGQTPDSLSSVMDLWNNLLGAEIYSETKTRDIEALKQNVLLAVKNGRAKKFKFNEKNEFIDCNEKTIDLSQWKGRWFIPKCLINSGY